MGQEGWEALDPFLPMEVGRYTSQVIYNLYVACFEAFCNEKPLQESFDYGWIFKKLLSSYFKQMLLQAVVSR